jgi:hypothetical protein
MKLQRLAYMATVAFFFFLICSTPHRVHHIFDKDQAPQCVAYTFVKSCQLKEHDAAVTKYAKEAKLVFPIALDLNSSVKRAYRIFGPPATFFIDAQG